MPAATGTARSDLPLPEEDIGVETGCGDKNADAYFSKERTYPRILRP